MTDPRNNTPAGPNQSLGESAYKGEQPRTSLTFRVSEARVEDVGHAIARLAPADLLRLGAEPGDVLKITGSSTAVGRAELSASAFEGMMTCQPVAWAHVTSLETACQGSPHRANPPGMRTTMGAAKRLLVRQRIVPQLLRCSVQASAYLRN